MPFTILSVLGPDESGTLRLTVRDEGSEGRTRHVYRLSAAQYASLGEPGAGTPLDEGQLDCLAAAEAEADALHKAVRLLSYGDNSAKALCRKLREHGCPPAAAEAAVAHVIGRGYLREEEQAYRFAVYAANRKGRGRRRILASLMQKGYPSSVASAAIRQAEADGEIDFAALADRLVEETFGKNASPEEKRRLLWKNGF